jgi:spore maturation protein CgeB
MTNDEDLAKKIKLLYDDKNYKEKIAQAGYEKAKESFNHDIQIDKLLDLIKIL